MKQTLTNYKLKNSRIVKVMKFLHTLMLPLAFISIVGRNTFMADYPVLTFILAIYMIVFFLIQVPFAIYFRYKYNKDTINRKTQFENTNNI